MGKGITSKHHAKGSGRWPKLPPELHPKADQMLADLLSRQRPEKHRYMRGLLTGTVTNLLLHPKDSKWGWKLKTAKARKYAMAKREWMDANGIPWLRKHRTPEQQQMVESSRRKWVRPVEGSKAGDTKQLEI